MINLKIRGKKFNIRVISSIVIVAIVSAIFIIMANMIDDNRNEYRIDRETIINKYENKIKEKDSINKVLEAKQIEYQSTIDSLEYVQTKIVVAYDKKIKAIYDASASDHAEWMESIINKLDSIEAR